MSTATLASKAWELSLQGSQLIETVAGTDKQQLLEDLYLRLILETDRHPRAILVLTDSFGDLVLRGRLRQRLRHTYQQLQSKDTGLEERLAVVGVDVITARQRLDRGLAGFSSASVYDPQGFWLTLLRDYPLQTGGLRLGGRDGDSAEQLLLSVADLWRREFQEAYPHQAHALSYSNQHPLTLSRQFAPLLGQSVLQALAPDCLDAASAEATLESAFQRLVELWRQSADTLQGELASLSFQGSRVRRSGAAALSRQLAGCLTAAQLPLSRIARLPILNDPDPARVPHGSTLAAFVTAYQALTDAYQVQLQAHRCRLRAVQARWLRELDQSQVAQRHGERLCSLADARQMLEVALRGPRGASLVQAVDQRYTALLVDDVQQLAGSEVRLLQQLFPEPTPVLWLGDPRQAVAGGGGGDGRAYALLRSRMVPVHTLQHNRRADPLLVQALNTLFAVSEPFLDRNVAYEASHSVVEGREPLSLEGDQEPPLRFWFMERDSLAAEEGLAEAAAAACAGEIVRLLNLGRDGDARLRGRNLMAADLAVLVRDQQEGSLVRNALLRRGVPSVLLAESNVFHSWDAGEMERLLLAVADPSHEGQVRAALATDLIGTSGAELLALQQDNPAWQQRLQAFHLYHRLWREHGFIRMFRMLMTEEGVAGRLLAYRDGERRLTNLLHLAELLQTAADRGRRDIEALYGWFRSQRKTPGTPPESRLRLESDGDRVRIVTFPLCLGEGYPVVFCPFLWNGSQVDTALPVTCSDPHDPLTTVVDFGSSQVDQHRERRDRERLAAELRLLYVALTRAEHQVYVIWGKSATMGDAALAWLLHQSPTPSSSLSAHRHHVGALSEEALLQDLSRLASRADGAIRIESLPDEVVPYTVSPAMHEELQARFFDGPVRGRWRRFHSLELADSLPPTRQPEAVLTLPRNDDTAVLKRWLVASCIGGSQGLATLASDGALDESRRERLGAALGTLRQLPLAEGWQLASLSSRQCLANWDFTLPVVGGDRSRLADALAQVAITLPDDATLFYGRGLLHDRVDLLVEVADRSYLVLIHPRSSLAGMRPVMANQDRCLSSLRLAGWFAQLALYRRYEQHEDAAAAQQRLGGTLHLFIPGVDPEQPGQVHWERMDNDFLASLDHYLAGRL